MKRPIPTEQNPCPPRRAHSIADIVHEGPFSRTFIYEAIKKGRLKARKAGRRTVIIDEDYQSYLESLPLVHEDA
jgi:hypothetical protein